MQRVFFTVSFACVRACSEIPPVLLGIPWPALRGPLRGHFWKKKRPRPYWGGENSGNALEASNALNYRALGIPAVLQRGLPGNALRAFPGSFRNPDILPGSPSRTGGVWPKFACVRACVGIGLSAPNRRSQIAAFSISRFSLQGLPAVPVSMNVRKQAQHFLHTFSTLHGSGLGERVGEWVLLTVFLESCVLLKTSFLSCSQQNTAILRNCSKNDGMLKKTQKVYEHSGLLSNMTKRCFFVRWFDTFWFVVVGCMVFLCFVAFGSLNGFLWVCFCVFGKVANVLNMFVFHFFWGPGGILVYWSLES